MITAIETKTLIGANVKKMLKCYGIKTLRCRIFNGKLFLTVSESDKIKTKNLLEDYNIGHSLMRKAIHSTSNGRTSFENLIFFV